MTGIVDWAASRARMVIAFIVLSILIGGFAYVSLPKEGEPDIEIPALFVSVQFPGISAEDSESLLVKPMENELVDLDGLDKMTATAAENYAGVALEFEFGWDKTAVIADVRDAMNTASGNFPDGAEQYTITEINFSEFPIVIVNLTGPVPVTEKILAESGMSISDIDLFEVNEAFAAVVLRFLQAFQVDDAKVNVNGGAIALGHPLGATGAMIIGTLLDELERQDKQFGLATLCIASGMGAATIIERV